MTILNEYIYEYVITNVIWKPYSWVGIILGLIIIFGGIWLTCNFADDADDIMGWLGGLVIGIFLVCIFCIFFISKEKVPVTRYEVILNNEITFNDFNDRYKVMEERGDILVVEEKNNENN